MKPAEAALTGHRQGSRRARRRCRSARVRAVPDRGGAGSTPLGRARRSGSCRLDRVLVVPRQALARIG